MENRKLGFAVHNEGTSQVVLVVKNPPANARGAGDTSLIPGLGKFPGGGHGNPLQYSCLEIPMDRGAWWATVCRVTKSRTRLKRLGMSLNYYLCNWWAPCQGNNSFFEVFVCWNQHLGTHRDCFCWLLFFPEYIYTHLTIFTEHWKSWKNFFFFGRIFFFGSNTVFFSLMIAVFVSLGRLVIYLLD